MHCERAKIIAKESLFGYQGLKVRFIEVRSTITVRWKEDSTCVGLLLLWSWRSVDSLLRLVYRILCLKFILLDPDRAITARFIPHPQMSL